MPISKQRNKHLQSVLIEAAKLGPRLSPDLALIYDTEKQKGHANRASIAVARKLSLPPCGRPQWTRVRSGKRTKSSGLKPLRRTSRFIQRDLPGPQMPTGRRSSCSLGFLRNVSGLAGNTHSIFCDGWKQPDTANGCLVLRYAQEPRREAQPRGDEQAEGRTRRSPERSRKSSPNLTETYHGSRLIGMTFGLISCQP